MMQDYITIIVSAILLGGLYALIGIGLSVMLGIMKVVNLAHGDMVILSSFLAISVISVLGISSLYTLIIIIPLMFILGFLIQTYLLNRVIGRGMEPPLLISFGLAIIIQNVLLYFYSADAQSIRSAYSVTTISIADILNLPVVYLVAFLISLIVIFALYYMFQKTYIGWAIRAASDDPVTARLMGINTKRIYAYAMGIALSAAAVGGVLYGMIFTFYPTTGPRALIIAFAVVILGGLGNMRAVLLGGIVFALAQLLGAHFFGPAFQLIAGYLVLVLVLAVKPQGLLGGV
jgi:branched-chain amino acid transport system permease protein